MDYIPYGRQWLNEEDIEAVVEVLKSDWLTTGPKIQEFEKKIAAYCGSKYAVCCSSGTAALHLAQLALGSSSNRLAVTSPITFLATANSVRFVDGDVRFSDVEDDTLNIDPNALRKMLESQKIPPVSGLIPVHFAGHPVDMEAISFIAKEHGLWVVEDASHAIGSTYKTKNGEEVKVGSCRHSDMTVFSFHPVKHIATGEGGAVTTNNEEIYKKLLLYRNHGMKNLGRADEPWFYEMKSVGYNYRLTDFQAALGISQLHKLDFFIERRREIANIYSKHFDNNFTEVCAPIKERENVRSSFHIYVLRVKFEKLGVSRGHFMEKLKSKGIGTQVHYVPVHLQPYYKDKYSYAKGDLPVAEKYYEEALSIPIFPRMTDEDVQTVLNGIDQVFNECGIKN